MVLLAVKKMRNQHQPPPPSVATETSARQLKRSNALRIKSNNLELLPLSLRESLQAIRRQIEGDGQARAQDEPPLNLLDQIKRGVKLRPAAERGARDARVGHRDGLGQVAADQEEEPISAILVRVLRQRYVAMQQFDGGDEDDDQSDLSSIGSDDFYLLSYDTSRQMNELSCVLYGGSSRSTIKRRSLLEQLGEYPTIKMSTITTKLTNDLVIRL